MSKAEPNFHPSGKCCTKILISTQIEFAPSHDAEENRQTRANMSGFGFSAIYTS